MGREAFQSPCTKPVDDPRGCMLQLPCIAPAVEGLTGWWPLELRCRRAAAASLPLVCGAIPHSTPTQQAGAVGHGDRTIMATRVCQGGRAGGRAGRRAGRHLAFPPAPASPLEAAHLAKGPLPQQSAADLQRSILNLPAAQLGASAAASCSGGWEQQAASPGSVGGQAHHSLAAASFGTQLTSLRACLAGLRKLACPGAHLRHHCLAQAGWPWAAPQYRACAPMGTAGHCSSEGGAASVS